MNPYALMIGGSMVVIVSYFFNHVSRKFKVPSVILLILMGFIIAQVLNAMSGTFSQDSMESALPILGSVGLIMIVLEAALDLKIEQKNKKLMLSALYSSILVLAVTAFLSAVVFVLFLGMPFYQSLLYAVPMSIMSSAIIIPSVGGLLHQKKEFMIYESTLSDIIGVMFFLSILGVNGANGAGQVTGSIVRDLLVTAVATILMGYGMIFIFQKLHKSIGLFFLLSILVAVFAAGKMLHVSSLLIIFFFGLLINNTNVFFFGKLKGMIKQEVFEDMYEQFKIVVEESAFLIRTFFFVLFGMSIKVGELANLQVWIISVLLLIILYGIRFLGLKLTTKNNTSPELYIAPRGLITILLISAIPEELESTQFKEGVTLLIILVSCIVMMISLMKYKNPEEEHDLDHLPDDGDENKVIPDQTSTTSTVAPTEVVVSTSESGSEGDVKE